MAKTPSLSTHLARKPTAPLRAVEPDAPIVEPPAAARVRGYGSNTRHRRGKTPDGRIGQTLRLSPEAWTQLKVLAANERLNAHDLLVESVNLLFRERGLPEIA